MNEKNYKVLLTQKEYCKVILANMMNRFGDSIDAIALTWLIYAISNSASLAALNYTANTLPTILFQPFAGAYVERLNKKKVMVICDIARGCIVALIAYLFMKDILTSWMLLLCSFALSCFEAFRQPCGNAILPSVLEKEYYSVAFSFSAAMSSVMELAGTAIAGLIIAYLDIHGAIFIDAFTFFFSACCLSLIKPKNNEKVIVKNTYFTDLKDGFKYLYHSKIKFCILLACAANAMFVPLNALQSALVGEVYHLDATLLSAFSICLSLGVIMGSMIYPKLQNRVSISTLICFCCGFIGLSYMLMILIAPLNTHMIYVSFGMIAFILGCALGAINPAINVIFMKNIDDEYLARTTSMMSSVSMGLMPVMSFIISLIAALFPLPLLFNGFGVLVLIISCILYFSHSFQVFDELNA